MTKATHLFPLCFSVCPVTVINELVGRGSSYRRSVEVVEIHFNEILDLSEDKDGGSVFQICRLSSLPPLHLLFPFIVLVFS